MNRTVYNFMAFSHAIPTTVGYMNTHNIVIVYRVEAIYEIVDEGPCPDVAMTTSPAYEGVKIN